MHAFCVFFFYFTTCTAAEDVAPSASCQYNSFAPHHLAASPLPPFGATPFRSNPPSNPLELRQFSMDENKLWPCISGFSWDSIPSDSTRSLCLFYVSSSPRCFFFLCFFLFVNNNFLQYSESELQMHLQHQHSAIYLVDTTGS